MAYIRKYAKSSFFCQQDTKKEVASIIQLKTLDKKEVIIPLSELIDLKRNRRLSNEKIAESFNVDRKKLGVAINKHNIVLKERDVDLLKSLVDRGLTIKEMAIECGCGNDTLIINLRKEGLYGHFQEKQNVLKELYKKSICCVACGVGNDGKRTFKETSIGHMCNKHAQQFYSYGKALDNNPRRVHDLNEIVLYKNHAEIILYNQKNIEVNRAKIDLEDVDRCKKLKWRINDKSTHKKEKYYCYSGSGAGNQLPLHRHITNCPEDMTVDHINSDTLDNRKQNLRILTQRKNLWNKEVSDYKIGGVTGVYYSKRDKVWSTEIQTNYKRKYFKKFDKFEEVVYLRYLAEIYYFKDKRNTNNDEFIKSIVDKLPPIDKIKIEQYFQSTI